MPHLVDLIHRGTVDRLGDHHDARPDGIDHSQRTDRHGGHHQTCARPAEETGDRSYRQQTL